MSAMKVPELAPFLECDRPLPDWSIQAMVAAACREILGR